MVFAGLVFVAGNNVINMVNSTGAFEIYLEEKLIYSKLETKKMPDILIVKKLLKENNIKFKNI